MSEVKGVVEQVGSKAINTSRGKSMAYSLKVDGQWYRTGFKDPEVTAGDQVKFEYEENQYGLQVDMKTFKSKKGEAPQVSQGAPAKGNTYQNNKKAQDDYWKQKAIDDKERQVIISNQAAVNSAIEVVKLALDHEGIPIGSKKAERLDIIHAAVIDIAQRFVAFSTGKEVEVASDEEYELPVKEVAEEVKEKVTAEYEDWD